MSYLTYKILMDPNTFDTFVQEMTVPSEYGECPLGKRKMSNEEVEAKWSQKQFVDELGKYGYNGAALIHIDDYKLFR